ncbi:MAG TPA: metalloregulator ArsR/SmtB family transcription factor [Thermoplasmata archaeon]|nr:metalloregulator ArsR/SmtB family transcription factor [Thermoplasmata archaeon]
MALPKPAVRPRYDPEWFEHQAEMMRVMANPKRLMILEILSERKRSVTEIADAIGMTLQNTSQHLRVMRAQRIVRAERDGQIVRYDVTSPIFHRCCRIVRDHMIAQAILRGEQVAHDRALRSARPARGADRDVGQSILSIEGVKA